jgi:hypothetical protein
MTNTLLMVLYSFNAQNYWVKNIDPLVSLQNLYTFDEKGLEKLLGRQSVSFILSSYVNFKCCKMETKQIFWED